MKNEVVVSLIIRPFRAYVFEGDIGDFVSPAFDEISISEFRALRNRKYNVTKIMANKTGKGREELESLISSHKLSSKRNNAMLVLEQQFYHLEDSLSRIGIIGLLELEGPETAPIPHEMTIPDFVQQRKRVFNEIQSQVEPIFVVTPLKELETALKEIISSRIPEYSFREPYDVLNKVYAINDRTSIGSISRILLNGKGYIADGHHRLKALQEINSERAARGKRPFQCFAYVTALSSDSLLISGIHRIVKGEKRTYFHQELKKFFAVSKAKRSLSGDRIGIYDGSLREISPLSTTSDLVNLRGISDPIFTDYTDMIILRDLLSIDPNSFGKEVGYTADQREAMDRVRSRKAGMAILVPKWNKENFVKIVKSGKLMRPKSTFFFPKIPAGIAIYRMK